METRYSRGRLYHRKPVDERFWEKVDKTGECWLWTCQRTVHGYGKFYDTVNRKTVAYTATRFVIFLQTGEHVPADKVVAHHCDNPACVRPDHLFVTTQAGNIEDAKRKGRLWIPSLDYRARSHCKHGHEYTPENTRIAKSGGLVCRTCVSRQWRQHRARRRVA